MQITRTETETSSGPKRTPREEIVPLFSGDTTVEPEGYWDLSQSTGWEVAPPEGSEPSRYTVMKEAIRGFIVPFEQLDAEAKSEQAEGSDEMGGVYFYPFSNVFEPIGEGDDDGDLNSSNFERKVAAMENTYFDNGKPQGGTQIMEAIRAADLHFMGEFGPDGDNVPRLQRPIRARTVWTDGELRDHDEFARYMAESNVRDGIGVRQDWDEVWAVAIFGYGPEHDATLAQYQKLAATHPNIHVYSFDQVSQPGVVAEDMAIAVVPQTA
jgi:hypothetical protein